MVYSYNHLAATASYHEVYMQFLDQVSHLTSRIEAVGASGEASLGTGFFFKVKVPGQGFGLTLMVTNKHVLKNARSVILSISRGKGDVPIFGSFEKYAIDGIQESVIQHPDAAIDLAAFSVGHIVNHMDNTGPPAFYREFDESHIPTVEQERDFTAIEDIVMVGYPTGIWDQSNNLPIVRRGITATPFGRDYNGRAEFMIDCACFPGSSGSPVLIASNGAYVAPGGTFKMGARFHLLGLLWGGPQYTTQGEIVVRPVPTSAVPVALSQIPTNLGYCVKSRAILDLVPIALDRLTNGNIWRSSFRPG